MKPKFIVPVLLSALLNFIIVSCGEDYSSPLKGLTVSDQTFETGTNSKTITVGTEDLSKCTVVSSAMWCSATIQGSAVVVNVQPNDTYEERQAIITLTDPEDDTTISFRVIQKQNDAILVDKPDYTIPEEGGVISIGVKSNVKYSVEISPNSTWLTKSDSSTRGLESSTIVLKAEKNDSGDERVAVVKLSDSSSGTSSEFTVKQELNPKIIVDKEEVSFYEDGGEFDINVKSNIALVTNYSDDWISSKGQDAGEGFSFIEKVKISPLPSGNNSREATIVFSDKINKWDIKKTITIKQIRSLSFQDKNVEIFVGDSYVLSLNNNTGQSVSWKSSNTSVATVSSYGVVTGISKGSTTITATTADGKYSDKITITVKVALYISNRDISIYIGDTYSLSVSNNTGKSLYWESSDASVATVDGSGKVTGIGKGKATITATTADGNYSDKVSVSVKRKIVYKVEAVDLGLSVLWSAYNLGAYAPEEFGEYFAWGETEPKDEYRSSNYSLYDNSTNKYKEIGDDISGTKYDAAHVNLGGGWRIPTKAEMEELQKKCTWSWTQIQGIKCYKVTGPNGNSIFIPANGYKIYSVLSRDNEWIELWLSTTASNSDAYLLVDVGLGPYIITTWKYSGLPIRPVKSK